MRTRAPTTSGVLALSAAVIAMLLAVQILRAPRGAPEIPADERVLGYDEWTSPADLIEGEPAAAPIASGCNAAIRGRAIDDRGRPVGGARVTLTGSPDSVVWREDLKPDPALQRDCVPSVAITERRTVLACLPQR